MTLLQEIQDAAIGNDSLSQLLRKCRVLAARLNNEPLAAWAEQELNGYSGDIALPDYRTAGVEARGNFSGMFQSQIKNGPIPPIVIDEKHRNALFTVELRSGVGVYEDLMSKGNDVLQERWPQNIVVYYQTKIIERNVLVEAWKVIPRGLLVGLLDQVRNRTLSMALRIEQEDPRAGEIGTGANIDPQKVSTIVNTNIYGGTNIVAAGTGNASGSINQVAAGDLAALRAALAGLGVPTRSIGELEEAIDDDGDVANEPGPRVREWLARLQMMVANGTVNLAGAVSTEVVAKMLLRYFGVDL